MKDWVVLFCIVAFVFAAFAIGYVIASVIRERRRRNSRRRCCMAQPCCPVASKKRSLAPAMLCGASLAIFGLLLWKASKEKTPSGSNFCGIRSRLNRKY